MAIGAILEDRTVARAKKGLSQLIALAPQEGRRLTAENGVVREEKIPAEQIQEGDLLRILPGEKIPVDGVIVEGQTSVDQSVMTGESLPADKEAGDEVYCGTLNCFGAVDIRATKVGADSSLQKLIRLVEEAEEKKAPVQRTADKWSVWLVPIALFIAVAAAVINWLLGVDLTAALTRGVTVLVVFCPCALALATPVSVMEMCIRDSYADFSPKPLARESGNGLHINVSVKSSQEKNVQDPFIEGVLRSMREITAYLNTMPQSYLRLGEKKAPRYITWSSENRSQLIRIPAAKGAYRRFELRSPDPMTNPYLAYALILYAGMEGVQNNYRLRKPLDENLFKAAPAVTSRLDVLPATLEEARLCAAQSELIKRYMPEILIG